MLTRIYLPAKQRIDKNFKPKDSSRAPYLTYYVNYTHIPHSDVRKERVEFNVKFSIIRIGTLSSNFHYLLTLQLSKGSLLAILPWCNGKIQTKFSRNPSLSTSLLS